jgi:putative DNA primase/helicase
MTRLTHASAQSLPDDEEEQVRAHLSLLRLQKTGGAMVDWALVYAGLDYRVFPCSPASKRPLTEHGFKDATRDPEKIRALWKQWPKAAIGMPTGAASGLLVIDVDATSETDALALVEELRKQIGGKLPACWMVTTPRGGLHLYYAMPVGAKIGNRAAMIKTTAGQIDVRGDGGYVILPPSRRSGAQARRDQCDGVTYAWSEECSIGDIDPPEAPQGLVELIARKEPPSTPAVAPTCALKRGQASGNDLAARRKEAAAMAALQKEISTLDGLSDGRATELFHAACRLGEFVAAGLLPRSLVEAVLEQASNANGEVQHKGLRSVRASIKSGLDRTASKPRDLSHIDRDAAQQPARPSFRAKPSEPSASDEPAALALPAKGGSKGCGKPPETTEPPAEDDGRPVIRLRPSLLHEAVDQAEEIIVQAGPGPIYQRSGQIVHVTCRPALRSNGTKETQEAITFAQPAFFRRTLAERARCERYIVRDKAWTPCEPPEALAEQYYSLGEWKLPILQQLIGGPTLRPDGTLLNRQGYDPGTGLYLTADVPGLDVPARPTKADAERANETLTELLKSFPFFDPEERPGQSLAVAMAGLLTAVARATLEKAPLTAVSAPQQGTGKSLLVDLFAVIATGMRAACVATGGDIQEFEKSLAAELLESRPLISLDNMVQPLHGQLLAMLLTQDTVKVRVLGLSKMVAVATGAAMFATGNNLQIKDDLGRRTLLCKLDAGTEHPENRSFDHDLLTETMRRRAELLSAALTILRWRFCWPHPDTPGSPSSQLTNILPLAGYADWCRRVRDPLVVLGHPDPVCSIEQVRALDDGREVLGALLEAWHAWKAEPATCRQAIDFAVGEFRDAIKAATREKEDPTPRRLGPYLRDVERRACNGKRFVNGGTIGGVTRWRVETC